MTDLNTFIRDADVTWVSDLIGAARTICNFYNLKECEQVYNFENAVIQEYLEFAEKDACEKLKRR